MPCITNVNLTAEKKVRQRKALEALRARLADGSVEAVVAKRTGAFALKGWRTEDREDISDLCAYRALMNAPEMRRAVMRAQAMSATPINQRTIASGLHSHDGGATWGSH